MHDVSTYQGLSGHCARVRKRKLRPSPQDEGPNFSGPFDLILCFNLSVVMHVFMRTGYWPLKEQHASFSTVTHGLYSKLNIENV